MSNWTAGEAAATHARLYAMAPPSGWGFSRGWWAKKKKWLQAKHPTEREAGWLRGLLSGWAPTSEGRPEGRSGQASTTALQGQLQEGAHAQGGKKKKKMLQLLQREGNGGEWRGVMAQRVREPGTDRHSRQPGPSSGNTQGLMSLIVC